MDENFPPIMSPNTAPTAPIVPTVPSKSPLGLVIKIIVGIIVVAVVGTGVALATRIWDPLWSPFRPEPEEVIEAMTAKMKEIKTAHSEMKIDLTAKEGTKEVFKVSLVLTGDSDNTDPENFKSAGDLEVVLSSEEVVLGSEGMEFPFAGEFKTIGQTQFIKLTTIPAFPFLQAYLGMLGIDLSKIKNQWIKYDQESYMRAMLGESYEAYLPQMEEQLQKQKEMQEEIIKKLKEILKDKQLYLVKKEFPDGKIREKKVYHYLVALNEEEAKKVILELMEVLEETFLQIGGSVAGPSEEKAKEAISKGIDEFFEKVGEIAGEVWIGKKDELLYRVKIEKEIAGSEFETKAKWRAVIVGVIVKFDLELSNFNRPITIEAPEKFIGIEKIISSMPFLQPGLPGETPGMYPPTKPEGMPSKYPYEQPLGQEDSFYLFQASLLRILSGILTK